jgi:hypothetical protein
MRTGTALVAIAGRVNEAPPAAYRLSSAFAAQLLAMRHDAPAFRLRRRAAPGLATAAYRAHAEPPRPPVSAGVVA